jgi:hypothetical protein
MLKIEYIGSIDNKRRAKEIIKKYEHKYIYFREFIELIPGLN